MAVSARAAVQVVAPEQRSAERASVAPQPAAALELEMVRERRAAAAPPVASVRMGPPEAAQVAVSRPVARDWVGPVVRAAEPSRPVVPGVGSDRRLPACRAPIALYRECLSVGCALARRQARQAVRGRLAVPGPRSRSGPLRAWRCPGWLGSGYRSLPDAASRGNRKGANLAGDQDP